MEQDPPNIRTGHDDDGREIAALMRERNRLTSHDDLDARPRIAEIDHTLDGLGVQRVAPLDGVEQGPGV
jgi:hypothetical protein